MGLLKERVWNERCKHMRIPTTSFQILNQTCGQKDTRKPGTCMPTANPVCSGHSSRIFIALKTWVGYMGNHTCLVPPGWYFTPQLHIHHTTLQGHKEHNQWRELISEQTSLEGIQPPDPISLLSVGEHRWSVLQVPEPWWSVWSSMEQISPKRLSKTLNGYCKSSQILMSIGQDLASPYFGNKVKFSLKYLRREKKSQLRIFLRLLSLSVYQSGSLW